MLRLSGLLLLTMTLVACAATPPSQMGLDQLNSGDEQGAYNTFQACAEHGDSACINNIGYMYENGHMQGGPDKAVAIDWYTLAARYGQPVSQQNLMRLGAAIPPADLQPQQIQQQSGGGEAALLGALHLLNSAAQGYSQGVEQAQQQRALEAQRNESISCTSRQSGNNVYTDCK